MKTTLILSVVTTIAATTFAKPKKFDEVNEGYTEVISTIDGSTPLFGLWKNSKEQQLLAELPRGWANKKFFIAVTPTAGVRFVGLQGNEAYIYMKKFGDRIAFITPEISVRSSGDQASKDGVDASFTDTVLIDVPIVATGPNGQPVIDLDSLLVGKRIKNCWQRWQWRQSQPCNTFESKILPEQLGSCF